MWLINGPEGKYYMCLVDDEKLIMDIIHSAPAEQKEFYFIDVGAGKFQWVDNIHDFLKNNPNVPADKKYHIIGLNAEGKDQVNIENNFIIYKLGRFKTENIIEAFAARKMHLNGKIDLIVSQWTLRHLADPLGTFLQLFELTKPNGYMLLEGIPFNRLDKNGNYIYTNDITGHNLNAEHLLRDMKQSYLMCPTNEAGGRALRDIMIQKRELDPNYDIGLAYHSLLDKGKSPSNVCQYISQFVSKNPNKLQTTYNNTYNYQKYNGDKSLYDKLIAKDLFYYHDDFMSFVPDFIISHDPSYLKITDDNKTYKSHDEL